MPRSTMLTGISGSCTSRRASSRSLTAAPVRPPEAVELLLERGHHLRVARSAGAPALEHVVPAAGVVEVPAPGLAVEDARERVVEHPLVGGAVRGDPDPDLLAVRHHQGQPPLPEL